MAEASEGMRGLARELVSAATSMREVIKAHDQSYRVGQHNQEDEAK